MNKQVLLIFVPIALALDWAQASPTLVFSATALALIPLIGLMSKATEQLSGYVSPATGGLLTASLGNLPDLIIGLFALQKGLHEVVKASISGAILANILFTLGLAIFVGGLRHSTLKFDPSAAGLNAGMLQLAAVALLIPAIFNVSVQQTEEDLSLEIAVLLFLVYLAGLIYTFTRSAQNEHGTTLTVDQRNGSKPAEWSQRQSLKVLGLSTGALAVLSETLTDAIEPMAAQLGLTPMFAGIILLALVGSIAELSNAIVFARRDQLDATLNIAVGASLQTALFVAPVLVFASYAFGRQPLDLLFSQFEIAAVVLGTFIALRVLANGETNWIEGVMAVVVYLMLGYAFYCIPG
ncbi:calcium/proton exchanger [Methylolobus aquaticus]